MYWQHRIIQLQHIRKIFKMDTQFHFDLKSASNSLKIIINLLIVPIMRVILRPLRKAWRHVHTENICLLFIYDSHP